MQPDFIPAYEPIPAFMARSGMSRSGVYNALARGQLRAVKLGGKTLIDVAAALDWMRSLPAATFRPLPEARTACSTSASFHPPASPSAGTLDLR